jgi:hypothetical protein
LLAHELVDGIREGVGDGATVGSAIKVAPKAMERAVIVSDDGEET